MLMYSLSAQDADLALCRCEDGVETALQYAKMWCRYAKDLLAWMEKRIGLGKCLRSWETQTAATVVTCKLWSQHVCGTSMFVHLTVTAYKSRYRWGAHNMQMLSLLQSRVLC